MTRAETQLVAKAKQLGLPLATLANRILKVDAHQQLHMLVPADFAKAHNVLPLFLDGDMLALAVAEPNEETFAAVRLFTRCTLQPFLARPDELEAAIERFYSTP
jgi:type IV pilus assembly protein PilB